MKLKDTYITHESDGEHLGTRHHKSKAKWN